ncbi:MAG: hypothetical protein KKG01_03050 [Candidatus Omnitrophica bacterium]|nr:hypothetical protein [Candidatus Omnitrophota bacterium]
MDRKNLELNAAIALAAILLVVLMVVFIRVGHEKTSAIKELETEKEKILSKKDLDLPRIKAIEEPGFFEEEAVLEEPVMPGPEIEEPDEETEEAEGEVSFLKDLPIESISEEEMPDEKTPGGALEATGTRPTLETQPSLEDMKMLKQKGLIIY